MLIVSKRNGEISKKTYPLTKDGIERTYKYYNVDDLKKKLPNIDNNHEGFLFLLKVQKIDFVHPDRRDNSTNLYIAGNSYNLSVNGTEIKSLTKIPLSRINIIEDNKDKYISIIEFTLDNSNKGYIYCNERGQVTAKLHSSDTFTRLSVHKESELVKHIGKVNAENSNGHGVLRDDREIENKKLVSKLRNYYNKDL